MFTSFHRRRPGRAPSLLRKPSPLCGRPRCVLKAHGRKRLAVESLREAFAPMASARTRPPTGQVQHAAGKSTRFLPERNPESSEEPIGHSSPVVSKKCTPSRARPRIDTDSPRPENRNRCLSLVSRTACNGSLPSDGKEHHKRTLRGRKRRGPRTLGCSGWLFGAGDKP